MAVINILTYSMHGYNKEGETMIKSVCEDQKPDIVFLQEHWLSPDRLYELRCISSNHTSFGISAMTNALSKYILTGIPFGGVETLIHNSYSKCITSHCLLKYIILFPLKDSC